MCQSEGVSEAKVQIEVVVSNRQIVQMRTIKLFEIHNGQRVLFLKTSLGFFPDTLAGLIKVIDSLQKYVVSGLSPVEFFLM